MRVWSNLKPGQKGGIIGAIVVTLILLVLGLFRGEFWAFIKYFPSLLIYILPGAVFGTVAGYLYEIAVQGERKLWKIGTIVGMIWGFTKVQFSIDYFFQTIIFPAVGAIIVGFLTFIFTSDIKSLKKAAFLGAVWGLLSSIGVILLRPDVVEIPFREIVFLPSYITVFIYKSGFILHFPQLSIPRAIIFGISATILITLLKERIKKIKVKPQLLIGFSFILSMLLVYNLTSNFGHAYSPINHSQLSTSDDIGILYANQPLVREIVADGPWRLEPNQTQIPIFVLVKDAGESPENPPYYLESVEIWTQVFSRGKWVDNRQLNYPALKGEGSVKSPRPL